MTNFSHFDPAPSPEVVLSNLLLQFCGDQKRGDAVHATRVSHEIDMWAKIGIFRELCKLNDHVERWLNGDTYEPRRGA